MKQGLAGLQIHFFVHFFVSQFQNNKSVLVEVRIAFLFSFFALPAFSAKNFGFLYLFLEVVTVQDYYHVQNVTAEQELRNGSTAILAQ